MDFYTLIEAIGVAIDFVGIAVIVIGALIAAVIALRALLRHNGPVYLPFRRSLGRSILLGLELLVAADIIKTVALTPTLESVAVLGGIVIIRTFLSFSLELEVSGRWPWQTAPQKAPQKAPRAASVD